MKGLHRDGAAPGARFGRCAEGGGARTAPTEDGSDGGRDRCLRVLGSGRRANRLVLFAVQLRWLCTPAPLGLALGLAALPLAMARLLQAQILSSEQFLRALLHVDERYFALWALVAASAVWADAEPEHRPLLFSWPVRGWALALAKLGAAGLAYALLAAAGALGLPLLFAATTGSEPAALPGEVLFVRALLPGAVLLALAGSGGALGGPWLGLGLGAGLWFLNLLDPTALWLDHATAGALHLFTLTRGSTTGLGLANWRQAVAALALLAAALLAPAAGRRAARHRPPLR